VSEATPTVWQTAITTLQQRIKPHNFDMWLRPIRCASISGSEIKLCAPNRYIKEWFEDNYLAIVLQELQTQTDLDYQVVFDLEEEASSPVAPVIEIETPVKKETDISFDRGHRYLFDSFVAGPSNQLAHAAATAVAEGGHSAKYNPLFICGGAGLGKTHLLYAIGHEIHKNQPHLRIMYLSSEHFMNDYIKHVRAFKMEAFRSTYRDQCDVLLMDDIQFIAGKTGTQEEFFHTFNALHDADRQIVVTSDKYPQEIPELEDRLRTRFQWGLIADIQAPELETRIAILKAKAEKEQIRLPDDVALFVATQIRSNVRELEGALIRLAALSSLKRVEISMELAKETLLNSVGKNSPGLTIDTIQKEVCTYFSLKVTDLRGSKRHKAVTRPRQIAMYLSRKLTSSSFPEIGNRFGGKDHSTVISACRKIEGLVENDLSIRTAVETLERHLQL
jgi:chromosomal replication initiator protein